jgi:hypothetical protein
LAEALRQQELAAAAPTPEPTPEPTPVPLEQQPWYQEELAAKQAADATANAARQAELAQQAALAEQLRLKQANDLANQFGEGTAPLDANGNPMIWDSDNSTWQVTYGTDDSGDYMYRDPYSDRGGD